MALKRIALHWGDSVAFCFVPNELPATLKVYDDGENSRQKSFFMVATGQDGFPLSVDDNYMRLPNLPFGNELIGFRKGSVNQGAFSFHARERENKKDTVNKTLAAIVGLLKEGSGDEHHSNDFDENVLAMSEMLNGKLGADELKMALLNIS